MTRKFVLTLAMTVATLSALPFAFTIDGLHVLQTQNTLAGDDQTRNHHVIQVNSPRERVSRGIGSGGHTIVGSNASPEPNVFSEVNNNQAAQPEGLKPRRPQRKRPNSEIRFEPGDPAIVYVKFRDEVRARSTDQPHVHVVSEAERDVTGFRALALQFDLQVEPLFTKSQEQLRDIEMRAAENSGRAQPDLAGYMKVSGPAELIELAAREINKLAEVEYVELAADIELVDEAIFSSESDWNRFERIPGNPRQPDTPLRIDRSRGNQQSVAAGQAVRPTNRTLAEATQPFATEKNSQDHTESSGFAFDPVGACCVAGTCADAFTEAECDAAGGTYNGDFTVCGSAGCAIGTCCTECVDDTAFCDLPANFEELFDCQEDFGTQFQCAAAGGVFLGAGVECDEDNNLCEDQSCGEAAAGSCFSPNPTISCQDFSCCETVCEIDAFCCDETVNDPIRGSGRWDEFCVFLAETNCAIPLHPCLNPASGPCDTENASPGCFQAGFQGCCGAVCQMIPTCCTAGLHWSETCALAAEKLCVNLSDTDGPTPDLSAGQGYLSSEPWQSLLQSPQLQFVSDELIASGALSRIGAQILPGWTGEGYNLSQMEEFADLLIELAHPCCADDSCDDPNLCDEADLSGGAGTKIAVFYPTAFVNIDPNDPSTTHEDLVGRVNYPETNQTQIIFENSVSGQLTGDFGTAVLGILGANPHNNSGVVGMAPDSELYFFPTVSFEEGGRLANAVLNAIDLLGTGDIFVFPFTPRPDFTTVVGSPVGHDLVSIATALGITSFVSAGDAACAAAGSQFTDVDSGAVVVGGVTPGLPYNRHPRSRFCTGDPICDALETVHISAWGSAVVTLGFGDLFLGNDDSGSPSKLRSYTGRFGSQGLLIPTEVFGDQQEPTSGAGVAQVASLAARIQGISRMFYDIPLSPTQLRDALTFSGFCQAGLCIGDVAQPPGISTDEFGNCIYDLNVDADPARVGSWSRFDPQSGFNVLQNYVFSNALGVAEVVVTAGYFDDCDEVSEAHVIRGQFLQGNLFSLCAIDSNYYILTSQATSQSSSPSNNPEPWVSQLNNVTYNVNGQVADLLVVSHAPQQPIFGLSVTFAGLVPSVPTFNFIQVYDWDANIWAHGGFQQAVPGVPFAFSTSGQFLFNPNRFVRNSDNAVLTRVWSFAFSGPTGPTDPVDVSFELLVDQVSVSFVTPGVVPEG